MPNVFVAMKAGAGGKSLYNHKHPNVVDTQIPTQADENGVYEWTWAPGDQVEYSFGKEGYQEFRAEPFTADGIEHEVRLLR